MTTETHFDLSESDSQSIPAYQRTQMALTLAALFCSERGLPLQTEAGKPSQQVAAVAAALLG